MLISERNETNVFAQGLSHIRIPALNGATRSMNSKNDMMDSS